MPDVRVTVMSNAAAFIKSFFDYQGQLGEAVAHKGAEICRGYFDTRGPNGSWPKNHPFTIEQKGHSRVGVNKGHLKDSYHATKIMDTWVIASNNPIAAIFEFGAVVNVTYKSRIWLAAHGLPLSGSTRSLIIPARPVIEPMKKELKGTFPIIHSATYARVKFY